MPLPFAPLPVRSGALGALPLPLLRLEQAGPVLHIRLNRPAKRNAINDALLARLHTVFVNLPSDIRAAMLHGAVVGGGLELASSAHLRVAEPSTFYGLPEGTRGIFVGGSGSVRISRLPFMAALMSSIAQGDEAAKARVRPFLDKRADQVGKA